MRKIATARIITIAISFLAITATAAFADQYVSSNGSEALYLAWTADGTGHFTGQLQGVDVACGTLKPMNASFNGYWFQIMLTHGERGKPA